MAAIQNVFLVGPMGVGKTTIGKLLAKKLHAEFVDLDAEIEKSCGADIAWIFDVEGEQGFRKRESMLLDQLTQKRAIVLATGGGAILKAENRTILAARGTVVYLKASIDQLYNRTKHDKKRPLLQVDNAREVLENLMKEREPLYQSVADIEVPTENKTPQVVADFLQSRLSQI